MESIQWKKTNAKISLKQKRSLGLFKKKYSFLLTYPAEIIRNSTEEETERNTAHKKALNELEHIFPILEEANKIEPAKLETEKETDNVVSRTLMVQDVEVSQEIFEKYENKKSLPLKYDSLDPNNIKIY